MTSPCQTQNNNVWETSLEKRLRRLHLRKVSQTRRNARIVGPWRENAKTRPAFEAQQGSCPRRSAAVIVRNKWWPRDDFHDACWNSFQSHPTQGATVEEPLTSERTSCMQCSDAHEGQNTIKLYERQRLQFLMSFLLWRSHFKVKKKVKISWVK